MKKKCLSLIIILGIIYAIFGMAIFFDIMPKYEIKRNIYTVIITTIMILIYFLNYINLSKEKEDLEINDNNYNVPSKVENYRDIPFNEDIIMAYYIGIKENIMKIDYILGVFLLKWLNEKRINIIYESNNSESYIDLSNIGVFDNKIEEELKNIFNKIAPNKELRFKNFKEWLKENYRVIDVWTTLVIEESKRRLIDNQYIIIGETYEFTPKLAEEVIKLKGLRQFLESMTEINEKEIKDIHLLEEYLIFAMSFGLADKIEIQLGKFTHEKLPAFAYHNFIEYLFEISVTGVVTGMAEKNK
ncbi:MAG: DUF2207 domain-containing protein [Bacilli bacterium]|nr:DUF2207 domain-containing protein [Bacilli bacterium]